VQNQTIAKTEVTNNHCRMEQYTLKAQCKIKLKRLAMGETGKAKGDCPDRVHSDQMSSSDTKFYYVHTSIFHCNLFVPTGSFLQTLFLHLQETLSKRGKWSPVALQKYSVQI
jgi:hypothetical protein